MENGPFIDGLPIKNGDMHSYVSLPEGKRKPEDHQKHTTKN